MSRALEQAAARAVEELERRARDLRRPRPADLSPEESDEHMAAAMLRIAAALRAALPREATEHDNA